MSTADELRRIAEQVLCVFNHLDQDGIQARSAPGRVACTSCTERVWRDLGTLAELYAGATDILELIPGATFDGNGARSVPGPRSPAVDALLVHTDPRSSTGPGQPPAALASIVGWARTVREDSSVDVDPEWMRATVPAGRVTMRRELSAIRGAWPWVAGQGWFPDFAVEVRDLNASLRLVRREFEPVLKIGPCPYVALPKEATGIGIDLECGAILRTRLSASEIRCRCCGSVWPKARWSELGDPWTDYAYLAGELAVNANTLRTWALEDGWRRVKVGRRSVVWRDDAIASYVRRRGPKLEEAG